ncbi:hypothetical protein L1999_12240 [Neobacillus drentensis]|uniref:hypothetical protein n=1 Tax=Neobacillus drentensis TaxID=220684 RepID=UPI001F2218A6|nr:hypothetical protein [Neobacillus drentensis]ULT59243.1 hypothetical protein L1999_12240 [Neobacillus drentensis]
MFSNLNAGDFIFPIIGLGSFILPILLVIVLIVYIIRVVRRTERRAEERLKLEQENTHFQQQQLKAINDLSTRLTNIESMLKEVE